MLIRVPPGTEAGEHDTASSSGADTTTTSDADVTGRAWRWRGTTAPVPRSWQELGAALERARRHLIATRPATFHRWRHARPFWSGLWTMLAAAIMLYAPLSALQVVLAGNGVWPGILVGSLVLICGATLWLDLQLTHFLGAVIILLSLVSFITNTFGGFLIGMVLGITGGALALAWQPQRPD